MHFFRGKFDGKGLDEKECQTSRRTLRQETGERNEYEQRIL